MSSYVPNGGITRENVEGRVRQIALEESRKGGCEVRYRRILEFVRAEGVEGRAALAMADRTASTAYYICKYRINCMKVVAKYSHKNGAEFVARNFPSELVEIYEIINLVDASKCRTKESKEKTMIGEMLYSPVEMNKLFAKEFDKNEWRKQRVGCEYSDRYYVEDYINECRNGFREMDFIKNKLGVEVQFGKYAFMVYNVCAKMTIFNKRGFIDAGVEIVPVKRLQEKMSTGVSYFEQFVWDLEERGVADIDIPVFVLGVDIDNPFSS